MDGLSGRIDAVDGKGQDLSELLLEAVAALHDNDGCLLYLVSRLAEDPDAVQVVEVWTDQEAHQASLQLPAVQDVIGRARPIIAGMSDRMELQPLGGAGLPVGWVG